MIKQTQLALSDAAEWLGDWHPLAEQLGSTDGLLALGSVSSLLRLKPDLLVGSSDPLIKALVDATHTIPIVMAVSGDPVGNIQAEVAARTGAGDARIFFVDTTGWLLPADFTDGTHPNPQGSAKAAQQLVTELGKHPW